MQCLYVPRNHAVVLRLVGTCSALLYLGFKADFRSIDQCVHVLVERLVAQLLQLKPIFIITREALRLDFRCQLFHRFSITFIHVQESILDVIDGRFDNKLHLLVQLSLQLLIRLESLVKLLGQNGHFFVERVHLTANFVIAVLLAPLQIVSNLRYLRLHLRLNVHGERIRSTFEKSVRLSHLADSLLRGALRHLKNPHFDFFLEQSYLVTQFFFRHSVCGRHTATWTTSIASGRVRSVALITVLVVIATRRQSFEVLLEVFDLDHDLVGVASLLVCQNLELILGVPLHENVVLVEHLDCLMNLENLTRLHVLKVHLPLLRVLCQAVDLPLEVRHLVLHVLLHGRHDLFDPGHLLGQRVIRQPSMLDRLLLEGIHFGDLVLERGLQELLTLSDRLRDLSHLLDRLLDVATSLLADKIVLDSLLVAHLFDKIGDLLHRLLNLRHDALLAIQCLLLLPSLCCANHLNLRVEPSPEVLLVLGPEGHFILELAS